MEGSYPGQKTDLTAWLSQLFSTTIDEKPKLLEESMDFPGGKVPFTSQVGSKCKVSRQSSYFWL